MAKSISRYLADISSTTGVLDGILSTAAQSNITSLGTLSSLTVSGSAAMTLTTAAQPNITSVGTLATLAMGGSITRTGDLTLDVSGDIILDAAGSDVRFHNAGTLHGRITNDSSGIWFISDISDKDIIFRGNDGGSMTTALTLDMSEGGAAAFNSSITATAVYGKGDTDSGIKFLGSNEIAIDTMGQETIRFDAGGRVGIGTNDPHCMLHIYAGDNQPLRVESTDAYAGIELKDNGSATLPPEISALSNDFIFYGGHASSRPELMRLSADGTVRFGTVSVERMRIDTAGRVGIGTAPLALLDFGVTSTTQQVIHLRQNGTSRTSLGISSQYGVRVAGPSDAAATGSVFEVGQNLASDGTTFQNTRFLVQYDGKVGIGNTSPNRQLSIKHASQAEIGFKTGSVSNGALIYYNDSENQLLLRAQESGEHIAFQTGGTTERMRINSDGNVLIGTDAAYDKFVVGRTSTSQTAGMTLVNLQNGGYGSGITWECKRSDANNVQTAARLYVAGASSWNSDSTASSQFIFFLRSANTLTERLRISHDGTFTGSGSNDISDQRLKENIKTIPNALTTIKGLTGRTFTWKEKAKQPPGTKYGFLAQEVQSVVSDLVNNQVGILKIKEDESVIYEDLDAAKEGEWAKSVQTTGIIPILVEAIKELAAKVEALESK